MKKYILFLNTAALIAAAAMMTSCSKDGPDTSGYTIYVTGEYALSDVGIFSCYWKNSERVDVPDMAPNYYQQREIFVSNGDVYLAGARFITYDHSGVNTRLGPSYWKNDVRTDLDMGDYTSGKTEFIKVANGKVYTAGNINKTTGTGAESKSCYWINNERTDITDLPENCSDAHVAGIFVYNNDVYVCGEYTLYVDYSHLYYACYWKNGVRTDMTETSSLQPFPSIFVDNGKVYLGGTITNGDIREACYWVDGKMTIVETGEYAKIHNIFVEKGIIYLSGRDASGNDCYWKGGSKTIVVKNGTITGMYVKDGIVFTSGCRVGQAGYYYDEHYPCYWVNTKRVELPFPVKDKDYKWNNRALGIFVE
jgi:hypothetical protein